jgi:hypothetical protein
MVLAICWRLGVHQLYNIPINKRHMLNQRCKSVLMKKKWQSNFIATSFGYVKSQIYITKNQGKQLSALERYHFYCLNSDLKTQEIFEHFYNSQSHDLEA